MKSQASATSQPPPSAKPLTAAITGIGSAASCSPIAWPWRANSRASCSPIVAIAAMSAPATKALLPAPVRTMPRRPDRTSRAAAWAASLSSPTTSRLRALSTCGRLIVMTRTGP